MGASQLSVFIKPIPNIDSFLRVKIAHRVFASLSTKSPTTTLPCKFNKSSLINENSPHPINSFALTLTSHDFYKRNDYDHYGKYLTEKSAIKTPKAA